MEKTANKFLNTYDNEDQFNNDASISFVNETQPCYNLDSYGENNYCTRSYYDSSDHAVSKSNGGTLINESLMLNSLATPRAYQSVHGPIPFGINHQKFRHPYCSLQMINRENVNAVSSKHMTNADIFTASGSTVNGNKISYTNELRNQFVTDNYQLNSFIGKNDYSSRLNQNLCYTNLKHSSFEPNHVGPVVNSFLSHSKLFSDYDTTASNGNVDGIRCKDSSSFADNNDRLFETNFLTSRNHVGLRSPPKKRFKYYFLETFFNNGNGT